MRAVVQRVSRATVEIEGKQVGSIQEGLLVYLGVGQDDQEADADYLCEKIAGLRVFEDAAGKMNLSVEQTEGELLVVSQFTLYGDCRKGKRPSFSMAAPPDRAAELYEYFIDCCRSRHLPVATGTFQAMMQVHSINDGPVTLLLDSRKIF
jgi:D-tyrosyl-tRNA(Tyr) deacylase